MSNIVAVETSPKSTIQSVTDNYFEVFDVLQQNRAKTLESRDIKSPQAHCRRYKSTPNVALQENSAGADEPETEWPFTTGIMRRYKSMPNMALQRCNSADDVPDVELPSITSMVELQVSTDLSSTELSATAPATAEVDEIEAPSNISSSSLPHVRPIEADVLQSSLMYNTAAVQFDGAEFENCSAKPSVHQANDIRDMVVTRGGCSDAVTNPTVTAVLPRHDVLDIELPSVASMVELQVPTDLSSTELSVTAPATAEVDEIEAPSNISSSLPHVRPIEADVLQSSPAYNTAALQFDGDESINCSAKPSVHQANGIRDMVVTRGGCCSDAVTNPTVTAVIPKRRSLWSRTKRFVRRMLCCGAVSA
ncbi:uncharacterized protein LOC132949844 [Metopolophium dirhodum]|uniref:uncharacterized protein LOC132949844 n=1 Tax=Metopolophium dirhodum TaxID=44670 RepID=UPI00298F5BDA|nr:uncharacterized protein LOC132949844 [Metopolophium dirhodum]